MKVSRPTIEQVARILAAHDTRREHEARSGQAGLPTCAEVYARHPAYYESEARRVLAFGEGEFWPEARERVAVRA